MGFGSETSSMKIESLANQSHRSPQVLAYKFKMLAGLLKRSAPQRRIRTHSTQICRRASDLRRYDTKNSLNCRFSYHLRVPSTRTVVFLTAKICNPWQSLLHTDHRIFALLKASNTHLVVKRKHDYIFSYSFQKNWSWITGVEDLRDSKLNFLRYKSFLDKGEYIS